MLISDKQVISYASVSNRKEKEIPSETFANLENYLDKKVRITIARGGKTSTVMGTLKKVIPFQTISITQDSKEGVTLNRDISFIGLDEAIVSIYLDGKDNNRIYFNNQIPHIYGHPDYRLEHDVVVHDLNSVRYLRGLCFPNNRKINGLDIRMDNIELIISMMWYLKIYTLNFQNIFSLLCYISNQDDVYSTTSHLSLQDISIQLSNFKRESFSKKTPRITEEFITKYGKLVFDDLCTQILEFYGLSKKTEHTRKRALEQ